MNAYIILLLVGASGGLLRAIIGWLYQGDEGETFSVKKTIASMLRASIAGAFLAWSTTDITPELVITIPMYASTFFQAIGADVVMKELYGTVVKPKAGG